MKKKSLIIELLIILSTVLLYVIAMLADLSVMLPPDFLILKYKNPADLLLALFSVQASISTISIAVVSIITGVTNETIYGVPVSKYITSIKPKIFKHKYLIIASLVWILGNYIFVSYNLFNCAIVSLLVSIVITIILVNNVSVIFREKDYLRKEILQYIEGHYDEGLINDLNGETIDAIETGAFLILKRNYEAYIAVLEKEIEKLSNQKDSSAKSPIIKQLTNSISDVFEIIVKTQDSYKINDAIIFICEIYDVANKNMNSPFYLQIWENIRRTYFNGIKCLTYDQLREDCTCWELRHELYQNIANLTEEELKEYDLRMYSSWLCYALCSKNKRFSHEEIKNIKKKTYRDAYSSATYTTCSGYVNDVYLKEVCNLHKYFIDECDEESINELYFKEFHSRTNNTNSRIIYLVTLIYLYYLSSRESLIDGKDLQKCAKSILENNHSTNAYFFYHMNILDATKESYKYIQSLMRLWEYMNLEEAKWMIIDTVILDFFVFTALNAVWEEEELAKIIDVFVPHGIFSVYSRYFPNENMESIKAGYQQFNEIFSKKMDDDSLNANILLLKSVFDKKYKTEEIADAANTPITENMLGDFKEQCLHTVTSYATSQFSCFAFNSDTADKENPFPVCEKNNVTVFETVVPSLLFKKEEFSSYFVDSIQQNLGVCFLNTISKWLKRENFSYKNRSKQQYLVDTIAQNGIDVDIVVGDKNKKWNENDKTLLFNVIQTAAELRFPHMNNYYFVLDSKLIEFSMSNFKVEFSDVELDELSDNIKKDESGRIEYNITNQLFVPFDESELKEYLHNIKRKVKITADIKYRISKNCVGAGISITVN